MIGLREEIRNDVLAQVDLSRELSDDEILGIIREKVMEAASREKISLDERLSIEKDVFNSLRKLDVLSDLLEDETITEVMINGAGKIFIERKGRISRVEKAFASEEKLYDVIQQIVAATNRIVNETTPIVDTRLADGSRVNIVLPPASVEGCIVSIRRFPKNPMTMKELIAIGSLTEEMVEFLKKLVVSGYNIFVSGDNVIIGLSPSDFRKRGSHDGLVHISLGRQ